MNAFLVLFLASVPLCCFLLAVISLSLVERFRNRPQPPPIARMRPSRDRVLCDPNF